MNGRSNNPILVVLDESPRAAQTLRFTVENLMHTLGETIQVVSVVPSSSFVHDSTSRLKSFLKLVMEPYSAASAHISLTVISSDTPALAIAEVAEKTLPRLIVLGPPCAVPQRSYTGKVDGSMSPTSPTAVAPGASILHEPVHTQGQSPTIFSTIVDTLTMPRRLFLANNSIQPHGALAHGGGVAFAIDPKLSNDILSCVPPNIPVVVARIPAYA
ncbi:hypothetical protein HDU97_006234 [Phlyctochytrium planicorne]|nr:hypothetical protein HDU97_006234 [Phlyctochytrium planicorne]